MASAASVIPATTSVGNRDRSKGKKPSMTGIRNLAIPDCMRVNPRAESPHPGETAEISQPVDGHRARESECDLVGHRHHGVAPICRVLPVAPSEVRSTLTRPVANRQIYEARSGAHRYLVTL